MFRQFVQTIFALLLVMMAFTRFASAQPIGEDVAAYEAICAEMRIPNLELFAKNEKDLRQNFPAAIESLTNLAKLECPRLGNGQIQENFLSVKEKVYFPQNLVTASALIKSGNSAIDYVNQQQAIWDDEFHTMGLSTRFSDLACGRALLNAASETKARLNQLNLQLLRAQTFCSKVANYGAKREKASKR